MQRLWQGMSFQGEQFVPKAEKLNWGILQVLRKEHRGGNAGLLTPRLGTWRPDEKLSTYLEERVGVMYDTLGGATPWN